MTQTEADTIISKSKVIKRDIDPVGFHTTIGIPEQYKNVFVENPHWSKASGKTRDNVLIGFVIYPPSMDDDNIVLEGFTYEGEYPRNESNYEVLLNK